MPSPRTILFVDGENLVFRYQAMLAAGKIPSNKIVHIPDVFVWHPRMTEWCYMDLMRVYFYSSVVGDDQKLTATKTAIAKTMFKYDYEEDHSGSAQIVPVIFKKQAKTHKTRQVDIQITIDMMRFAQNPSISLLYLVSGDGDYLPLIQETMRLGNEVYVASLSSGLSPDLRYSVDEFLDLDPIFFPPPKRAKAQDTHAKPVA